LTQEQYVERLRTELADRNRIVELCDEVILELNTFLRTETARDRLIARCHRIIESRTDEIRILKEIIEQRDEGIRYLRLELARLAPDSAQQHLFWDNAFEKFWDVNGGPRQTTYFMQVLVAGLRTVERDFLSSRPLQIADWGCATGEGVQVLSTAFPSMQGIGVDISKVAIEKARERYPSFTFIATERGELDRESVDVLVTSNCLEHFYTPIEVLETLLAASRWLTIILVPYREIDRIEGHRVSFSEESFPETLAGFTRLYADVIPTEAPHWDGNQLLVVYASPRYLAEFLG